MDPKKLEDFITNAALLAGHLTQQCEKVVSDQKAAATDLRQAASDVGRGVAAGQAELTNSARAAVREALAQEMPSATSAITETGERLRKLAEQLEHQQASAGIRMGVLAWKSLGALVLASIVVIGGTGWYARSKLQEAGAASARAEVLAALEQVQLTSCDGKPCIKLEEGLPQWERNEDYVLVEADPSLASGEAAPTH